METLNQSVSLINALVCSACKKEYSPFEINTYAHCCNQPLVAEYDISPTYSKEDLLPRDSNMWRYAEMLPVLDEKNIVTLGEGMTPILPLSNLSRTYGFSNLLMKDESFNPTGSFKARGLSVAVSKARELGIDKCIVPTAGNAGGALAAYCAKAGIQCTVVMPTHTPSVFKKECQLYGAELVLVDGLINDCAKKVDQLKLTGSYFDMSTLKEPYRLEGKKTMGYEIAEQLNWVLPDYIVYPTGGGTGLIAIWKAFQEMLSLGWITGPLPKMIAVQSLNCNPIMRSLQDPKNWKKTFSPLPTVANGLAVPYPFGMTMMQRVLKESGGTVFAVSEEEIIAGVRELAKAEGILVAPEGAAVWKAVVHLRQLKTISPESNILMLNTGSGYKYLENLE
ncbi:MAG: threonine synthase [Chitinophagaceae bacterium]